jgi:hypothetical protein
MTKYRLITYGFCTWRKKYKNILISGSGASEKCTNLSRPLFRPRSTHACQLSPIDLLTQSLKSSTKNVLKCTERIQDILKYEMRIKCTSQTLHIKIIANQMNIMGIIVTIDVTDIMVVNVFVACTHAMQLPNRRINCNLVIDTVSDHPEPEFLNFYGAQESILRNQFRKAL